MCASGILVSLLFAAGSVHLVTSDSAKDDIAEAALAADDECRSAGPGEQREQCALNAIQLRGQKVLEQAQPQDHEASSRYRYRYNLNVSLEQSQRGSCKDYGCSGYSRSHSCQCNSKCTHYKNCCGDYKATCAGGAAPKLKAVSQQGTCKDYGCGGYSRSHSCQCNSKCTHHKNCCDDYTATCMGPRLQTHINASVGAGPPFGHPSASIDYPTYHGFTLWLAEEFDESMDLDKDPIWTWSDGGLSEGQVRFVKEGIRFEDGKMKIEVREDRQVQTQSCSNAEVGHVSSKRLTSGEMRTRYNLFRYGRYEVRMKAPSVQPGNTEIDGNYISTMFVYRDAKFKHWREIDMEVAGDSKGTVMTNMLSADHTSAWRASIQKTKQFNFPSINVRQNFHTYAFEWLPNSITWFLDGKEIRKYTGGSLPIPDMSGKIMMNLWIFGPSGGFGGKQVHNNRYPMHNEYDWFRFYAWNGDKHYPCPSMDTSCLTADDQYLSSNNPCDGIAQTGKIGNMQPCIAKCGA